MKPTNERIAEPGSGFTNRVIRFSLENRLVVILLLITMILAGISVAPFDWESDILPRSPVAVDALPNLGENQQIVFVDWPGRSPHDIENQVTYPLTVQLLGLPGAREVRSTSMFGFSTVYIIFEDDIEFYWARSRILEKLNSLPAGTLPEGVMPTLGPDATGLGQVFWYTLEGRDPDGNPVGGWDLHEIRSVQDYFVRYGLLAREGISEVASIGGFVQEYQVDVDPEAMRAAGVSLEEVFMALSSTNLDVGARTTEINRVEYVVRGVGLIQDLEDIEGTVIRTTDTQSPIRVQDVANVTLGPAERRGMLDKGGAEAVGGVVVVRQSVNPLAAIDNLKDRIAEISTGLPSRVVVDWQQIGPAELEAWAWDHGFNAFDGAELNHDAWTAHLHSVPRTDHPDWVTTSTLTIVPFYDRTGLIHETLGTLEDALSQQILITIVVILLMLVRVRASIVISLMLPLAVLMSFIAMWLTGIDANLVALAGIAIAIGTVIDMGIIVTENVMQHLRDADPSESRINVVYRGAAEVGTAVVSALTSTVISFLPVFAMTGAEGRLFQPLAFTKTFMLISAIVISLTLVPLAVYSLIARRGDPRIAERRMKLPDRLPERMRSPSFRTVTIVILSLVFAILLANVWEPLGPERGVIRNMLFVGLVLGGVIGGFKLLEFYYEEILAWALAHKKAFLSIPLILIFVGLNVWIGFDRIFGFIPNTAEKVGIENVRATPPWSAMAHTFPGLGREFMPALDEGSFLWMPTVMPHASIGEAREIMAQQNLAFEAIPEVESVVGKLGRAESAFDPAPISMFETVINYKPEYIQDASGRRINFAWDRRTREFLRDDRGELLPDSRGRPFRQWREHIRSPQDIWDEIVLAGEMPGMTSAPLLQPIQTRQIMLQTGMNAPMGIKVSGPDLETVASAAVEIERHVRQVPAVVPETVQAERIVGKPYLEVVIDRDRAGRFGLRVADVQNVLSMAVGGMNATTTIEGRERYDVRVRYPRELRGDVEAIERLLVDLPSGATIPLGEISEIRYVQGPEMIRSENTFPVAYVTFGGAPGVAEVNVVEAVAEHLDMARAEGRLHIPAGITYTFAGNYQNQIHASRTLSIILPISLFLIFMILYFQFRHVRRTLIVCSGIAVAWAGGFVMLWLYGQGWFADFSLLGVNMRELFQMDVINLSIAVWVGFLALFGLAVDDGIMLMTYLSQNVEKNPPKSIEDVREATLMAGRRRVRPLLMTSATTIIALLPILTSTGRGADIMIPMAIPSVGGMTFVTLSMFTVPVLFAWLEERKLRVQ